jgi:hypothetical protein
MKMEQALMACNTAAAAADDDNVMVMTIITWWWCSKQEEQTFTNPLLECLRAKSEALPLSGWTNCSAADPNM